MVTSLFLSLHDCLFNRVRAKRKILAAEARLRKTKNYSALPRKALAMVRLPFLVVDLQQAARAEARENEEDDDYEDVESGDSDAMDEGEV
jgi:hypothetical protein